MLAAFDTGIGTGSSAMGWLIHQFGFRVRRSASPPRLAALALPYFLFAEKTARGYGRSTERASTMNSRSLAYLIFAVTHGRPKPFRCAISAVVVRPESLVVATAHVTRCDHADRPARSRRRISSCAAAASSPLDAQTPEAQALASRNGAIVAVGTDAAIARYVGPATQVIDLAGQLAMPGFIEGHGHFTGIGENSINLDFMNTKSWDEIVHMVAQAVEKAKPGEWIVGRGWHQDKWTSTPEPNVEGFPLHASLDKVSPNNPVVLTHASGHASFVNAKAMELSGITEDTANPTGGEILKDKDGNPTGLLRETRVRSRARGAGAPRADAGRGRSPREKVLELADEKSIAKGITTFQDAGSSFDVDRPRQEDDRRRPHARAPVDDDPRRQHDQTPCEAQPRHRLRQQPADGARDQGLRPTARSDRAARGCSSRTATSPTASGLPTTPVEQIRHARPDRARRRLPGLHPRDRRPRESRSAEHLRGRVQEEQRRTARICAGASSTRSTSTPPTFRASASSA